MSLQGQRIVIIGGSSGIGLAAAQLGSTEGASVVIASRSEEKLRGAKEKIGGTVETFTVDVTDEESVKQ